MAKTADRSSFTRAGQQITFSFLITNTGNVTVSNVSAVEGSFTGSGASPVPVCPAGAASLAPGATVTCTAPYTVTASDVSAGGVSNTASAVGVAAGGPVSSAGSTVEIDGAPADPVVSPIQALGNTGVDIAAPALVGMTALALGLVLVARARRRRTTQR